MWHPSVQDILTAHEAVKQSSEVRAEGLRGSRSKALKQIQEVIQQAIDEDDVNVSAAVYLKKLIDKHPFRDGNKRTALLVASRFLDENGGEFRPHKIQNTDELYNIMKWELPSMSIEETAYWIKAGELPDDN